MAIMARLKLTTKELLGCYKKWPRPEIPKPNSYEEQIYQALVHPGDACFDIGANDGEVSLFLAKLAGHSGVVTAFEPVWPVYCELCRLVQYDTTLKAPIITIPFGLADIEKPAAIHVPNGKFGYGSMAGASTWSQVQGGAKIHAYQIQITTVDAFLCATGSRIPDFIKIDVEGAELFVLHGGAKMFNSGHRPLMLIEVFAPWERAFEYQPWILLSYLLEFDYRFLFVCKNGLVEHIPTEKNPFPPDYETGYNLIAYDPKSHGPRVDSLNQLRADANGRILQMAPPPQPNRLNGFQ